MHVKTSKMSDWNPGYSVGVEAIDEQHRHFFDLMNALYDLAESAGATTDDLRGAIKALDNYASMHFATEEKYFKKFKFEGTKHHCDAHHSYVANVREFFKKIDMEGSDLKAMSEELAEFAASWLIGHIAIEDKKYTQCFRGHGLK